MQGIFNAKHFTRNQNNTKLLVNRSIFMKVKARRDVLGRQIDKPNL